MRTRHLLIILLTTLMQLLTALPLFADSWEGKVIAKIAFEQDGTPLEESLIQIINMKPGAQYQAEHIRQAMERLYATGMIENIKVEVTDNLEDQITVKWVLSQKQILSKIAFSGLYRFPEAEALTLLHFVENETVDYAEWEKRIAVLTSSYKNEGYFNIQIESQFKRFPDNPAKTELLLKINEGGRARIHRLNFTGTPVFPNMVLRLSVVSQNPEHFSMKLLQADIDRLNKFYKKHRYRKVMVGPPSIAFLENRYEVDITLPIVASTKSDFFFHGSGFFPLPKSESLAQFIDISNEDGDDDAVLENAAYDIQMFYVDLGYPFAKVSVQTKRFADEDRMEAHFTIENITRARIRKINFLGHNTFSRKRLLKLVKLKEEGFFTKTHFTEEILQEDAENISLFYKKEGFLDVRVTPDISFDEKKKWATLIFKIEEGNYTWVETISLKGAGKLSDASITNALSIQRGDSYNKGILREGARQILTLYSRLGYLDAKVDSEATFSEDHTRAQLEYKITEGEQAFLGSIKITGNLETKERVFLREMALQRGDPFDNEKILLSQQQLSKTGLFSNIHFEPEHNIEDKAVQDLHLIVGERPRWALEFGVGYLDTEKGRGFIGVNHRNLFGTGRKMGARFERGVIERRFSLNYKEPHVFSSNADATIGTTYFKTQAGFNPYDEEALVGTLGFEKQLSPLWKGVILYEYKDTHITNLQPKTRLTNQDEGKLIIASINPSFIRDTRDDLLNPTSGSTHVITLRTGAISIGSETQLVKITHQSSFFFPATPKATLALSVRGGGAKKFGETKIIPLSERFFSGGRSTVRGYGQNELGILGETIDHEGFPQGGNAILIFNEELRISIYKSFGMVLFFDHGNVWREFDEISLSEIKSTTGIGFRYNTPVGPFRIDWGYKLNRENSEPSAEFQFMLGHAF